MKRRERPQEAAAGGRRPFTRAELAEVHELTAQPATPEALDRLREIHAAAGRQRLLRAWELDPPSEHDPEFAYAEETADDDPDLGKHLMVPWSPAPAG